MLPLRGDPHSRLVIGLALFYRNSVWMAVTWAPSRPGGFEGRWAPRGQLTRLLSSDARHNRRWAVCKFARGSVARGLGARRAAGGISERPDGA